MRLVLSAGMSIGRLTNNTLHVSVLSFVRSRLQSIVQDSLEASYRISTASLDEFSFKKKTHSTDHVIETD